MSNVPLSHLPEEEKAARAGSFGEAANHYDNFRPGPPEAALDWILQGRAVSAVVDLGAGTGACTKMLLTRADQVTAVEPDDRMRAVLSAALPQANAVDGRGEAIPLPDASVDAVFASSSWHWMDPVPTLLEVGRVLRPGGTLGVVWSGPDPEGPFVQQARALLESQPADPSSDKSHATEAATDESLADLVLADADRPTSTLEIPTDSDIPFDQPGHEVFTWDVALTADDLIGLLGTFSWIILMPEEARTRVLTEARRLLKEVLGIEGPVTVDVRYRAEAWRAQRQHSV
jgi:SAM-dependent methyltransferase